jgi:Nuclease-related domain
LERDGWVEHHSVVMDGGTHDRDHIVIGPRGVFLLDSKAWRGRVTVENGALIVHHGDEDRPRKPEPLADRSNARAAELARAIQARTGSRISTNYRPFVGPAIVVWGDFPQRCVESGGVTFVHGDHPDDVA